MAEFDGYHDALRAVVHVLYESALWEWHRVKEYEIGNKITRNHAFKVNILAVATISSEQFEYTF